MLESVLLNVNSLTGKYLGVWKNMEQRIHRKAIELADY